MFFFKLLGLVTVSTLSAMNPQHAAQNPLPLVVTLVAAVMCDYVADKAIPLDSGLRSAMNLGVPQGYIDHPWFVKKDGSVTWNEALNSSKSIKQAAANSNNGFPVFNISGDGNLVLVNNTNCNSSSDLKHAYINGASKEIKVIKVDGVEYVSDPAVFLQKEIVHDWTKNRIHLINSSKIGKVPHSQVEGLANVQPASEVVNNCQLVSDVIACDASASFGEVFLSCYNDLSSFIF